MSIFTRLFGRKTEERAEYAEDTALLTFFTGSEILTKAEALEVPTVAGAIKKIAETVSRLPVKLYRRSGDNVEEITDDPRLFLLNGETGDTLNTVDMWRAVLEDYYLGYGGWIYVDTDGLRVRSLRYVDSSLISIMRNNAPIFKAFKVSIGGRQFYDFQFIRLFRKTRDGFTNIPLQNDNSKVLSAAYNALKLENSMNSNGGCKSGFLKAKNKLGDAAIKSIREGYDKMYSNNSKVKMAVLNDGVDFQEISATAAELQMSESKKGNSIEICKLFGFPHTILDGGASESDKREFVNAVVAIINQIETVLDAALLLESEKEEGYYWAFDTKELTRGSVLERYQAYEIARRNNILQVDEIRREEDYDPLGFNYIQLGLGDVLLNPKTMEVFTPNTGEKTQLDVHIGDKIHNNS